MSIQDFVSLLNGLGIGSVYPLAFPKTAKECHMIEIGQGSPDRANLHEVTLTITNRAKTVSKSESNSIETLAKLKGLTDVPLSYHAQVVLIKSQQLLPQYVGKDKDDNHYHMLTFRVLVNV